MGNCKSEVYFCCNTMLKSGTPDPDAEFKENFQAETEIKPCWDDGSRKSWKNVSLEEFLTCKYNLAANRQVRMLADLSVIGCYSDIFPIDTKSERYKSAMEWILKNAKDNLKNKISFFTLTEFQRLSQYLFEQTFNKNFDVKFVQKASTVAATFISGDNEVQKISERDVKRIKEVNKYKKLGNS